VLDINEEGRILLKFMKGKEEHAYPSRNMMMMMMI
jgi:hypothetical protein